MYLFTNSWTFSFFNPGFVIANKAAMNICALVFP